MTYPTYKRLMYSLNYTSPMRQGEHGKRNDIKTRILVEVISGNNTSTGLKNVFCSKAPTDLTMFIAKSPYAMSHEELPDAEHLDDVRREIRDGINQSVISKKDVEYHLRSLQDMGLITKSEGRYYPNRRSARAMKTILLLLQSKNEYEMGITAFMQMWAGLSEVSVFDAVRSPLEVAKSFSRDFMDFMSESANIRDFVNAWGRWDDKLKIELGKRFRDYLTSGCQIAH